MTWLDLGDIIEVGLWISGAWFGTLSTYTHAAPTNNDHTTKYAVDKAQQYVDMYTERVLCQLS